jgi:hypothetical protein
MPEQPTPPTGTSNPSDDELLDEVRAALGSKLPVPDAMVELIMTGYDITNLDSHLAELVEDTLLSEAAGVRSSAAALPSSETRLLTFRYGEVTIEVELGPVAPHLVGHVDDAEAPDGPEGGSIHLDQAGRVASADLDDLGAFELTVTSGRPFRLRYQPPSGDPVVTDWLLP